MPIVAMKSGRFAYPEPGAGFILLKAGETVEKELPLSMLKEMVSSGWIQVIEKKPDEQTPDETKPRRGRPPKKE